MDANDAVLINAQGLFFNTETHWGDTDSQFWVGSRPNAIRLARRLHRDHPQAKPLYVVTGYGTTAETWERVLPNGDYETVECPF